MNERNIRRVLEIIPDDQIFHKEGFDFMETFSWGNCQDRLSPWFSAITRHNSLGSSERRGDTAVGFAIQCCNAMSKPGLFNLHN